MMLVLALAILGVARTGVPSLSIDLTSGRHTISPEIYGMNDNTGGVDTGLAKKIKLPVSRWGGDGTTRYNWLNDGSNSGFDWYFIAGSGNAHPVPGASSEAFIARAKAAGGKALLTVPMIDYINKATSWDCSFPVSLFGQQQSVDPYLNPIVNGVQTNAGNSLTPSGGQLALTTSQILRTHVPNSPALAENWVKHLVSKFGTAASGGIAIYQLDNEPSGWSNTHRDIRPVTPTYQEIVEKSVQYSLAIKSVDPTASVLGPSDYGVPAYEGTPSQNGGLWNAPYYLKELAAYSKIERRRLLDYFDEHYYPTTPNNVDDPIANSPEGDAGTQAARLECTRSLWDPGYIENDWIGQFVGPIALIPSMHTWIDTYYPGTKLAITEYNFGGLESMNGALAQADVLGIFGREGADLATMWGPPSPTQPGAFAFLMYRNYDGNGSTFGDVGVHAVSSDQSSLAIYAAQRSTDNAVTAMVINKTAANLTTTLSVTGTLPTTTVQVFTYSGANLSQIVAGASLSGTASGVNATFPGNSITLLVWK